MANVPPTDDELRAVLAAVERHGTRAAAAGELGMPARTVSDWMVRAKQRGITLDSDPIDDDLALPHFPAEDMPVEKLIDMACDRFETRKTSFDAHTWFPVKVKGSKPIGVLWFGDPHVDDNGCNWPVLRKHCGICATVDGLYGANIGDTTNNWAGRLQALYAKQDASLKTARRYAEWFMLDSKVPWLIWLLGNHDLWGDGAAILAQMAKRYGTQKLICHEWEARFSLDFANGASFRIHASHDFKGHSMWNPLHGPMKQGKFGQDTHLLVCGHKHNWAVFNYENADRALHQTFIRCRGYKYMDDYARQIGVTEQERGSGILTIFDPRKNPDTGGVLAFDDVEAGAEYLTWLRKGA